MNFKSSLQDAMIILELYHDCKNNTSIRFNSPTLFFENKKKGFGGFLEKDRMIGHQLEIKY